MKLSMRSLCSAPSYYDIIISGGGMVGSAMACCLASSTKLQSKSFLLLEADKPKARIKHEPGVYSNRVSAINPASKRLFEKIGVWNHLTQGHSRIKTVKQLKVWDSCSTSNISFEHDDLQNDVAYIVENTNIVNACTDRLNDLSKTKQFAVKNGMRITKLSSPHSSEEAVDVQFSDGSTCRTSLVIGADGAKSEVRSAMQSHYISWAYDQKAIVATLELKTVGNNSVAWQRFTPTGPIALLPLDETKSSLVWTTTDQEADRLMALPDDQFVDQLNDILWKQTHQNETTNWVLSVVDQFLNRFSYNLNQADQLPPTVTNVQLKSRASFPLGFGHATRYIGNRSVLIGDAAHRLHPLAGQGVNLGFGDCCALTAVLEMAMDNGADIGSTLYLKEYESQRQLKNLPVMLTMDFLNRLYRHDFLPLVLARSIGLNTTNHASFLKKFIMAQASSH